MAWRKNVIFIGMTQNGKSSLIQQILRYAGKHEEARSVGIGEGNFSETQTCSLYDVEIPLKTHRLRQIDGPEDSEEQNGSYLVPGEDFDFDDVDDYTLGQDVEDSGVTLALRLIDTPGLSDTGNTGASTSGMRVIDERHKLRILLTLQKVEDVHAICFVVRRDTNYGGDFRALVKRMVSLMSFSTRSTAWNLQYHIIHTNIDVDDRASGVCGNRQRGFDEFGPAGAIHHFVDNLPDPDFPLDIYFANQALSGLFRSLASGSSVNFSNLHYPKSPEHECNDQILVNALAKARVELEQEIETCNKSINALNRDIERYNANAELHSKRVEEYEAQIGALDCDTHSVIEEEDGWTEKNFGGGGSRIFSFSTSVTISKIEKSNDGDGDWKSEVNGVGHKDYQVTLQPHWLYKAYGKIKIFAKKSDKHSRQIESLQSEMRSVKGKWHDNLDKVNESRRKIKDLKDQIANKERVINNAEADSATIHQSGHSISLAEKQSLIKYFTVDSPYSAALAYQLTAVIPWTIAPLSRLPLIELRLELTSAVESAKSKSQACEQPCSNALSRQLYVSACKRVLADLKKPPLGEAKLRAALFMLHKLQQMASEMGSDQEDSISFVVSILEKHVALLNLLNSTWGCSGLRDEEFERQVSSALDKIDALELEVISDISLSSKALRKAIWKEKAIALASSYLSATDGLPIGMYASLIRAASTDPRKGYLLLVSELEDVCELDELALDD